MNPRFTPSDLLAAIAPAGFSISLSQVNHLVSIGCALFGAAYLAWKWRRESPPPASK